MTAARCRRGSRTLGRTIGYVCPRDREPVLGSESGLLGHELPPRQYARTWFANSRTLIGFSRYPANPASRTHSPPAPKADDVSATIGIPAVRG